MIKIEITDPHLVPRGLLIDTATYLMKIAGAELVQKSPAVLMAPSIDEPSVPVPADSPRAACPPLPPKAPITLPGAPVIPAVTTLPVAHGINPVPPPPPALAPFPKPPAPVEVPASPPERPKLEEQDTTPRPVLLSTERDTNGIPWDNRIHIKSRAKNPNGTWKIRRDVDIKIVEEISEQLKAIMKDAPKVSAPPTDQPLDWGGLMTKITSMIQAGKLTQKQVAEAVKSVGIPTLPILPTKPELIPIVAMLIDSYTS